MRRIWPVAAVAAGFALAGCTVNVTTTGSTPAPPPSATAAAAGFVSVVRAQLPEVARDRADGDIQAIADSACADLAAGRSADDVVAATRSLGTLDAEATDQATARELIKLAIDTTCLDQAARVDEF